MRFVLVGLCFVLAGCANRPVSYTDIAARCPDKIPTDHELMVMDIGLLLKTHELTKLASSNVATARAFGAPIDPCAAAFMYLNEPVEQALKVR